MKTNKERSEKYRDKIKQDPARHEEYKRKERERYRRRVEEGKHLNQPGSSKNV